MSQNQSFARRERQALATALRDAGPDAPTLCEGWDTGDLAAHVWQRDNRMWQAAGLGIKPLAGYTRRTMDQIKARPLDQVAAEIAEGPVAKVSPFQVDRLNEKLNESEMFIHTEDVRRANGQTDPRVFGPADSDVLWRLALGMARMALRGAPTGVALARTGDRPVVVKKPKHHDHHGRGHATHDGAHAHDSQTVTVVGPAGELVLWLSGRREHAQVELTGSPEAIAQLQGFTTHL